MMTVAKLIEMLEKVETKGSLVYIGNPHSTDNMIKDAVIEHDLKNDMVSVVLKTNDDK